MLEKCTSKLLEEYFGNLNLLMITNLTYIFNLEEVYMYFFLIIQTKV